MADGKPTLHHMNVGLRLSSPSPPYPGQIPLLHHLLFLPRPPPQKDALTQSGPRTRNRNASSGCWKNCPSRTTCRCTTAERPGAETRPLTTGALGTPPNRQSAAASDGIGGRTIAESSAIQAYLITTYDTDKKLQGSGSGSGAGSGSAANDWIRDESLSSFAGASVGRQRDDEAAAGRGGGADAVGWCGRPCGC